jgi:hypothetical protein
MAAGMSFYEFIQFPQKCISFSEKLFKIQFAWKICYSQCKKRMTHSKIPAADVQTEPDNDNLDLC